jgi:hypothetical protein
MGKIAVAAKKPRERDLAWLVERRSQIQRFLLELYEFDQELTHQEREAYHPVFGLLVGVGFSLWRAVFLSVKQRTMRDVIDDASRVLTILIETNAIGFPQDRETEQWMVGYYDNNAIFRLHCVVEDATAWQILASAASQTEQEFFRRYHPNQQDHYAKLGAAAIWEDAYQGAALCLALLHKAHQQKRGNKRR